MTIGSDGVGGGAGGNLGPVPSVTASSCDAQPKSLADKRVKEAGTWGRMPQREPPLTVTLGN